MKRLTHICTSRSTPRTNRRRKLLLDPPLNFLGLRIVSGDCRSRWLSRQAPSLAARDCADDEEGLGSRYDRVGQRGVGLLMRKVLAACEEAQEGPTRLRDVVADRTAQHRVPTFECVDDGALCDGRLHVEFDFAADAREPAQVRRENDANHGSVWTSTESTAGRSRTIGDHVSPASADA